MSRIMFEDGAHQGEQINALVTWMRQHGRLSGEWLYIVDVGANIDTTSIPLCLQTGKHILAAEPVPENLALLERNVHDNNLSNQITCIRAAVAERPTTLVMRWDTQHIGGAEVTDVQQDGTMLTVPAQPLDVLLAEQRIPATQVAFVWSDTQGFERQVIASGTTLWPAGVPLWVEIWPEGLAQHGGIDKFMATADTYFTAFLTLEDLYADGSARPLNALYPIMQRLRGSETDILLLPR